MSRAIAVCQNPDGHHEHVPAEDIVAGRCFEPGCECTPLIYVAVPAEPVTIARCPEHGLHGARLACFECGGPVEQVRVALLDPS